MIEETRGPWLPPPFGAWLVDCKYLLVGCGFAAIARALYLASAPLEAARAGPAAAFTFFVHFLS
ncbi:MAG: hypothetical protein ACJ8HJ_23675 [Massilia sp.]